MQIADGDYQLSSEIVMPRMTTASLTRVPSWLQELVTELVSRHQVVICSQLLSDQVTTCKPRFRPKKRP